MSPAPWRRKLEALKCFGIYLSKHFVHQKKISVQEACGILGADRAAIFLLSNDKSQLTLMVAEGAKEITVPVGVGIAGGVAETGANVNIPDCYEDRCIEPLTLRLVHLLLAL